MAAVVALLLLPHPVAGDERHELSKTRQRLGAVESVLRDARADAGAVAAALAAADQAVAGARERLAVATQQLAAARHRRADAMVALEAATDEVGRQEARLAEQVRGAYMTGQVSGLAVVVQVNDLRDLLERAITLSYVISADQDALGRLEVARKRAVQLHNGMVKAEQARVGVEDRVRVQLGELERVRAVRQRAKERLDGRVAKLAGAAAALRSRSAELRRLIRQEGAGQAAGRPWRRTRRRRVGAAL